MAHSLERVVVNVPLNSLWIDTGIVLSEGDGLRITASGVGGIAGGNGTNPIPGAGYWVTYPEGTYLSQFDARPANAFQPHANEPQNVKNYGNVAAGGWLITNTVPSSLCIVIRPDGQGAPPFDSGAVGNGIYVGREFEDMSLNAGRVWIIFNDVAMHYGDNYGAFTATVERLGTVDKGKPSPIRFCPPGLLEKRKQPECVLAWCIAIKPRFGAWEGFTGWDLPLILPAYADELGNVTPPLLYRPAGAQISNIPTQLKLGSGATDAKILAPRSDAIRQAAQNKTVFLERAKILKKYYEGAFWELFDLDPEGDLSERMAWTCGEIGQITLDDLTATAEMTTYEEVFNRVVGDQLHVICQVGARRGENFGLGRCRCEIVHNGVSYVLGVKREDWTASATVVAGSTKTALRLRFGEVAQSGQDLHPLFHEHLGNGDLAFSQNGGANSLFQTSLRGGLLVSQGAGITTVEVFPKLTLPYTPVAGDAVLLTAGCDRSKGDCKFFENLPQMRAQDLPGNDDLLRRYRLNS